MPTVSKQSIGAGGMGEVYRARDTRLGREVADQDSAGHLGGRSAAPQPLRTRGPRGCRAQSPEHLHIHDVGHDQGIDFLVMELVDGESLAARLTRGPLPLDRRWRAPSRSRMRSTEAHRHGIVHRDLKPGNMMLARAGSGTSPATHAKLLDFGLARIVPAGIAGVRRAGDRDCR